ncbi:non-ribosomal peptide synthetase, partial [Rhodanobacter sp. A1T4]|uniref:non-ribosomal peptide synthetase n=1 Tax=Rhodanobacter sp. A1T4 TaxID=2723087 RepID=UPI00161B9493
MAGLWAELLKLDKVGIHDDFFALGGHSLLATQLISRIRRALQVELSLRALFEAPTISALMLKVAAADTDMNAPSMLPVNRDAPLPLSFAQARLWFLDQLERHTAIYNIPSAIRLDGQINVDALERALNDIVRRHESLRTSFVMVDDEPIQIIAPTLILPLTIIDLSNLSAVEREVQLRLRLQDDLSKPFGLEVGPLIRFSLIRLADEEHVLLLTMHHIVSDGWSVGVVMRELATLYGSFTQGLPSPLSDLPIQYADFAQWQRQWLSVDVLEPQLSYWKQQLADSPSLLTLPTDRPRPSRPSNEGAMLSFMVPTTLVSDLQKLGRRTQSTLFMTLCAAFNVLLARYSGQSDICIGTPIANRNRSEIEDLVGFFVNTLVLRNQVDLTLDFKTLLQQVRQCALDAYAHQDVPFEQLVEVVQPERHTSYTPLFQVMLVLQNTPMDELALPGLSIKALDNESVTAKFDLTLILTESKDGLQGCFEYSTDLFDASTIARLADHLTHLLEVIVTDPTGPVGELAMLGDAERYQLLHVFNDTAAVYLSPMLRLDALCIHQRFEQIAQQTPDALAVIDGAKRYSYEQLNQRANRLAHLLRTCGVRDGDTVAIALPRSVDLIVAELAVVKAGAAYVPLDAILPIDRQTQMLKDCGARCVITHSSIDAPDIVRRVELDRADIRTELTQQPDYNLATAIDGAACAYIMYTSGSTGQSKGVQVPHRAIERLAIKNGYLDLQAGDRFACAANPAFDASTLEIWVPLQTGAAIVIVSQDDLMTPAKLATLIREQHVTGMWMTVGLFNQYAQALGSAISQLHALIVGGDVLDPHIIGQVLQNYPPKRLINGYGPTETTTFAATFDITQVVASRSIPIGRPIGNTCIYLLDRYLQPVPIGVAGEIYIGGAGVALGYINLPSLTRERFIADPFAPAGHIDAHLYKTGDLGRYLPDGNIEFLGRNDFQVKIRGFRIELGEVEAKLKLLPQIRETVVLAREDNVGDKRLVAYLVAHERQGLPEAAQLRTVLSQTLPEYMVPSYFVTLDRIPLTPNGKVDRKALPAPDMTRSDVGYVASRTPSEEIMAGLWAELLKLDKVGIHDDFFALGGHSLLATQLISRIRRSELKVELPLRALFEAPTIAALMLKVAAADTGVNAPPLLPVDRVAPLPLSFAQARLWFLDQLERHTATYNIPSAVRLTGQLKVEALARTLNEIVRRHEALRTTFVMVDDAPVQVIAPVLTLPLDIVDLSRLPVVEREEQVRLRLQEEVAKPFDLAVGPLVRFGLLRLADEEHILYLTMHHIVSDGWSVGVVMHELAALYRSFTQGQPSPLSDLPIQYADFAQWQRQWLSMEVLAPQLSYWKQQLANSPSLLTLPTDRPRPARLSHRGAMLSFMLPATLVSALRGLGNETQGTLFMTLYAAFNVLLARYSGQSDICIGTPIAN